MKEKEKDPAKVLDRMRRLCSRREYCTSEVLKKIRDSFEGDGAQVNEMLDVLVREKYVDDLRYASAFARDKSSISGWGEVKIRYMLSSKRIPKDVIDMAVKEIDGAKAEARLLKLMESKFRTLKDDPQCRIKMIRFGLGRGYGYEEVADVLDSLMSN